MEVSFLFVLTVLGRYLRLKGSGLSLRSAPLHSKTPMLEDSRLALRHLSHGRRFFRCGLPRYCSTTPHSETALNLSGYGYILPLTTLSLLPEGFYLFQGFARGVRDTFVHDH